MISFKHNCGREYVCNVFEYTDRWWYWRIDAQHELCVTKAINISDSVNLYYTFVDRVLN